MRIRKYYSSNPHEAFKQIRAEMGVDAIILGSQKVRRGWLGFIKGPVYEVTAVEAGDEGRAAANANGTVKQPPALARASSHGVSAITPELEEIRASLDQMQKAIDQLRYNGNDGKAGIRKWAQLARLHELLAAQGLEEEIIRDVTKQIDFELSRKALQDWAIVQESATKQLERRFTTIDVNCREESGPRAIFVAGPTGVGKTTTVAKLAAMFAADKIRNVYMMTVDTLRIGAIPQLQAYADILGIPLEVVYSPAELARNVATRSKDDVILIDTPGWSPQGAVRTKLPEFVNAIDRRIVLLAISSTTKDKDAVRAVAEMEEMPVDALILTKLDETVCYGSAFNVVRRSGAPVAFITTGQNVPEDIEFADARKMAVRLFGAEK